MVRLTNTFSHLQKINALVVGDFMLDKYTFGNINRISPEAPVSILGVTAEKMAPGGAGNVVMNLLSLGANVTAIGRVGDDLEGDILLNLLKKQNAKIDYLFVQKDYKTPLKNRFIAESQQVLRVDFEKVKNLSEALEKEIIMQLPQILADIQVIAISDYAKGFLSDNLIKVIIELAREKNIPIIIDPKGKDFIKYKNADILKPNLKEAYLAANLSETDDLNKVASILLKLTKVNHLLITRSKDGMSLFSKNGERKDFPVRSKEIKDVTGAGDAVLAMICMAVGNNLNLEDASQLSNIAASITVEHVGCIQVSLSQFAKRLLEYDVENKIFDSSHLFALKKVLENKKFYLIGINTKNKMIPSFFKAIKSLSSSKEREIIIFIQDANPDEEFIELLSSLNEIDYIILHNKNLKALIKEIKPQSVFLMKEDSLIQLKTVKDLLCSKVL